MKFYFMTLQRKDKDNILIENIMYFKKNRPYLALSFLMFFSVNTTKKQRKFRIIPGHLPTLNLTLLYGS